MAKKRLCTRQSPKSIHKKDQVKVRYARDSDKGLRPTITFPSQSSSSVRIKMLDPNLMQNVVDCLCTSAAGVWSGGAVLALLNGSKASSKCFAFLLLLGSILMAAAVLLSWPDKISWTAPYPFYAGLAPFAIRTDPLSTVFLVLLCTLTGTVSFYTPAYLEHIKDHLHAGVFWFCLMVFVLAMAQVIMSANALTFLIAWELMSLSSVALVATNHVKHSAQKAALIYLGATQISTAFITAGFLWLHNIYGSWYFTDWHSGAAAPLLPSIVLLVGFSIKAGIWPFHGWLPYAHAEAPAPVSALMSAAMVKIALYAIIRILVFGGKQSPCIAYIALSMGLISAVWGILYALIQKDLKRLLAYSTVENVGLILSAVAIYMLSNANGLFAIATLSMTAAILHTLNHASFKALLFLGAGSIDISAHTRNLELLGGLSQKMPRTMAFFFIGCLSICALPPLNGFVSKWFIYRSLLDISNQSAFILDRAGALIVASVLAIIGALALACFTKALGVAFLGRPRSHMVNKANDGSLGMLFSQGVLASICILLGIFAAPLVDTIQPAVHSAMIEHHTPSSVFHLPLGILLSAGLILCLAFAQLFLRKPGTEALKKFSTWDCGYGNLPGRAEISGTSFADSIATFIRPILGYNVARVIKGKDRRHFPEQVNVQPSQILVLEKCIYAPMTASLQWISRVLVRLQTGSIHVHLLYVFMTVFILVLLGIRL